MEPRLVELAGEPREMGRQFGEELRGEIHALAEERLRLAVVSARAAGRRVDRAHCLALAGRFFAAHRAYAPEVFAEFEGIAAGADIAPELLLIGNGYTDYKDVLAQGAADQECSAFLIRADAADGRTLCGQTWDMHATAEPYVVLVRRRPRDAPATLSLTTAGCLSLIGINECGIAVGNNNLVPTDARPGVVYLAIIHRVLAARTWEQAVTAITGAPRASGHNYYLADAEKHLLDAETTATLAACISPRETTYVHTNHYTARELLPFAAPPDPTSTSVARLNRLSAALAAADRPLTPEGIRGCLADHGTPGAVCAHNSLPDGGKSCGVAVICPQTRELWARVGNPCAGALYRFAVA